MTPVVSQPGPVTPPTSPARTPPQTAIRNCTGCRERDIRDGNESLRVGDDVDLAGAVGEDLPNRGHDEIAEEQHDAEHMQPDPTVMTHR